MNDNSIMPYGKHKGKQMANVPAYYLIWLYDNNKCSGKVKQYIQSNMEILKEEIEISKE